MLNHFGAWENADIVLGTAGDHEGDQGAAAKRAWEVEDSCAREATKGAYPSDMRSHTTTSAAIWQTFGEQVNPASSEKGRVNHFDITAVSGERLSAYFSKLARVRDSLNGTIVQLFDRIFRQQPPRSLLPAFAVTKEIIKNKEPPQPPNKSLVFSNIKNATSTRTATYEHYLASRTMCLPYPRQKKYRHQRL